MSATDTNEKSKFADTLLVNPSVAGENKSPFPGTEDYLNNLAVTFFGSNCTQHRQLARN